MIEAFSLISVIIPVYNGERFLAQTIDSVLKQTFAVLEVIVVDDGSTDATGNIIDRFISSDSRVKKIAQSNSGVSAARNTGFRQSRGEYIAFLDADDLWLPNNLELKLKKFREGVFGLVHSDARCIDENGEIVDKFIIGCEGDLLDGLLSWKSTQVPGPSSILVKRAAIEKAGLFDEKLSTSADFDFFIRLAAQFHIGRVNAITWHYRLHANNMHMNVALMEHDVLLVYKKVKLARLFKSSTFQHQCFGNMYLTLAASWYGDGKSWRKALRFVFLAIMAYPPILFELPQRVLKI